MEYVHTHDTHIKRVPSSCSSPPVIIIIASTLSTSRGLTPLTLLFYAFSMQTPTSQTHAQRTCCILLPGPQRGLQTRAYPRHVYYILYTFHFSRMLAIDTLAHTIHAVDRTFAQTDNLYKPTTLASRRVRVDRVHTPINKIYNMRVRRACFV